MSKFKQLVKKLEKKGMSPSAAAGTAYDEGRAKYGKKEMARKAAAGRRKAHR